MILINEKEFLEKFNYVELLAMQPILEQYKNIVKNNFTNNLYEMSKEVVDDYTDAFICEYALKAIPVKSLLSIIYDLSYNELCLFYDIFATVCKENKNEEVKYVRKIALTRKVMKEKMILNDVIPFECMTIDDFSILMNNVSNSALDWYAIDCKVEPEDLTPEILYNKYHKEEFVLRRNL